MHKPNSKASLSYWHMRRIASIYQHPFHTGIHTGIQTSIKVTSFSFIAANAAIASAYTKGIREAKIGMKWLTQIFGKKKDSKHQNHISYSQKQKKTKINDTTYQSDIPNDGFPGGHPEEPRHAKQVPLPHKTEDWHGNFSQTTQTHKTSKSVTEQVALVGDYIDDYNRKLHTSNGRIEIDIIILEGLLDNDQKLTEPKPGTQIRFISNPRKSWRYKLHTTELRGACAETRWHTTDRWIPDDTLDKAIQEKMFRATEHEKRVYISGMSGIIIRKPPPEYRICQRIDRLGDPRSKSQPSSSERSRIVEDIRSYIEHNKLRLEDKQAKSRQIYREQGKKYDINPMAYDCGNHHHQSQGVMIPDKLIEKWQNDYGFKNVHFWLDKIDYHSCLMNLREGRHRHIIGHVMIIERSKSRESGSTKTRHDSAISIRHDPGSCQRPPPKANTYKSSDYGSDSGTSTRGQRRGQNSAQLPSQREPSSAKSNRDAPPKKKPSPHPRPTPSIHINPSNHEERQGKSPAPPPPPPPPPSQPQINRSTKTPHLKPSTTTQNHSPVSPLDEKYVRRWEYQTAEQKAEIHRKVMQELKLERVI
ncbi:predicted protein [Sclerotinia sclerotiorum 1980 UF-70]|uniref:Uncharacterized protein n=1 Tax=Sclerotinia sclerotiorum (strain ATCC 18683 / 1980 / Ss-1) TaxID=665079 RepID=A7ECI6_SCLS1|nr:predicted protein [Sclerotinia sclerotiorum 1980 UF-70]EDO00165.1 predicted protein [Sclerotinia sclerotiorum 1980 UF-70]